MVNSDLYRGSVFGTGPSDLYRGSIRYFKLYPGPFPNAASDLHLDSVFGTITSYPGPFPNSVSGLYRGSGKVP